MPFFRTEIHTPAPSNGMLKPFVPDPLLIETMQQRGQRATRAMSPQQSTPAGNYGFSSIISSASALSATPIRQLTTPMASVGVGSLRSDLTSVSSSPYDERDIIYPRESRRFNGDFIFFPSSSSTTAPLPRPFPLSIASALSYDTHDDMDGLIPGRSSSPMSSLDGVGSIHAWEPSPYTTCLPPTRDPNPLSLAGSYLGHEDFSLVKPVARRAQSLLGSELGFDLCERSVALTDVSQLNVSPPAFEWDWRTDPLAAQTVPLVPSPVCQLSAQVFYAPWEREQHLPDSVEQQSSAALMETKKRKRTLSELLLDLVPREVSTPPPPRCPSPSAQRTVLSPSSNYSISPPLASGPVDTLPVLSNVLRSIGAIKVSPARHVSASSAFQSIDRPASSSSASSPVSVYSVKREHDDDVSVLSPRTASPTSTLASTPTPRPPRVGPFVSRSSASFVTDLLHRVTPYTRKERARLLDIYRQKRGHRRFGKRVTYQCRKKFADNRPRVGGRFVKIEDAEEMKTKPRKRKRASTHKTTS